MERRYAELSQVHRVEGDVGGVEGRRAGRRAGRGDAAGARPRARREAARPGGRAAGDAAGAPRCGAAAATAPRPVGAEVRGVPRLPVGGRRRPIDRLDRLAPAAGGREGAGRPRHRRAARPRPAVRAGRRQLVAITPPPDLSSAHATLRSAAELGQQAMRTRERAAIQADVAAAWDASSAAAGSILMLAQATAQIDDITRPPELR